MLAQQRVMALEAQVQVRGSSSSSRQRCIPRYAPHSCFRCGSKLSRGHCFLGTYVSCLWWAHSLPVQGLLHELDKVQGEARTAIARADALDAEVQSRELLLAAARVSGSALRRSPCMGLPRLDAGLLCCTIQFVSARAGRGWACRWPALRQGGAVRLLANFSARQVCCRQTPRQLNGVLHAMQPSATLTQSGHKRRARVHSASRSSCRWDCVHCQSGSLPASLQAAAAANHLPLCLHARCCMLVFF